MTEIEFRGCTLVLPAADFTTRAVREHGDFEPQVLGPLMAHLRAGMCVLDIGANLGMFALPIARAVGAGGRVIAVEPSPRNLKLLRDNQLRNGLDNLLILPAAASDALGPLVVRTQRAWSNCTTVELRGDGIAEQDDMCLAAPMDLLLGALERLDVVKLDIEGFEHRALLGMRGLVRRHRPVVALEYSSALQRLHSGVPGSALLGLMRAEGYACAILREAGPEPVPETDDTAAWVEGIDAAWQAQVADGGTHLDLWFSPREAAP
jgi:FkbM family methyltransferase